MTSISGAVRAHNFQAQLEQTSKAASAPSPVDRSRGYPVGDGSFAQSVRGTSPQRERDLHLALMANDVYTSAIPGKNDSLDSRNELAQAGWQRLMPVGEPGSERLVDAKGNIIPIEAQMLSDPDSGFDAAIYQNEQGQYVVAFRGTDQWMPGKGSDADENGGQASGLSTKQYEQAVALAELAEMTFGEGNVVFAGHSLGGGLASAAMVATGEPGVTFNAAGLSDETLRQYGKNSPNALREDLANSGQIRRYNVEGDLLTVAQQDALAFLPDAVGHELRVAAPRGMGWNPVDRHGGGGAQQSYVEGLRQNEAYRPFSMPPLFQLREQVQESRFNAAAAAGRNAWDVANHTGQVLGAKVAEMQQAVGQDASQGHLAPAALRVGGDLADGVLDIGAGAVRESADLAGDLAMEGSTLGGNVLRSLGFDGAALHLEHAGHAVNQWVDKLGDSFAKGLDKAGDGVEWAADKAADGVRWVTNKTIEGAQWAAEKTVQGAQWIAEKTADGAQWVAEKTAEGAQRVLDKASDGLRWMGQRLNPANW